MYHAAAPQFKKNIIAVAVIISLTSTSASSLTLSTAPPGTVEPYVAPNVIISIDDSGSMGFRLVLLGQLMQSGSMYFGTL